MMSERPRWSLPGSWAQPWAGGSIERRIDCVLAPNPGPMTLDGTNTWLIGAPDSGALILVDPGPDDARHRAAVRATAERRDARISQIVLTHGHLDHSEGARAMAQEWGVGVRAIDPRWRLGAEGISEGDRIETAGVELRVMATPGHTSDSLSLVLTPNDHQGASVFTGDSVLGRGTAVIAHPDGELAAYLTSLRRLRTAVEELGVDRLLPGHGPMLDQPDVVLSTYMQHRAERLDAVRAARDGGARTASDVVALVYAEVDRSLWPAAELSVQAQLDYLDATTG